MVSTQSDHLNYRQSQSFSLAQHYPLLKFHTVILGDVHLSHQLCFFYWFFNTSCPYNWIYLCFTQPHKRPETRQVRVWLFTIDVTRFEWVPQVYQTRTKTGQLPSYSWRPPRAFSWAGNRGKACTHLPLHETSSSSCSRRRNGCHAFAGVSQRRPDSRTVWATTWWAVSNQCATHERNARFCDLQPAVHGCEVYALVFSAVHGEETHTACPHPIWVSDRPVFSLSSETSSLLDGRACPTLEVGGASPWFAGHVRDGALLNPSFHHDPNAGPHPRDMALSSARQASAHTVEIRALREVRWWSPVSGRVKLLVVVHKSRVMRNLKLQNIWKPYKINVTLRNHGSTRSKFALPRSCLFDTVGFRFFEIKTSDLLRGRVAASVTAKQGKTCARHK
jgi:hypothetical protein